MQTFIWTSLVQKHRSLVLKHMATDGEMKLHMQWKHYMMLTLYQCMGLTHCFTSKSLTENSVAAKNNVKSVNFKLTYL